MLKCAAFVIRTAGISILITSEGNQFQNQHLAKPFESNSRKVFIHKG